MKIRRVLVSHALIIAAVFLCLCVLCANEASAFTVARQTSRRINVAVLDFGDTETGARASEALHAALAADSKLLLMDRSLVRTAARGVGYTNSLNMTLAEARDLGAAIGCDFFITGDAQTLRRSPSTKTDYFEAYASIFVVSAATGKLLMWNRTHFEAAVPAEAEKQLLTELNRRASDYTRSLEQSLDEEIKSRAQKSTVQASTIATRAVVYEEAPTGDSSAAKNFRAPQPYQRLRPPYPLTAAQAEAEATVDASVDVDANGEVANVSIVRWAGFGLDDATINTIRQLHFRPAMRDGIPVPVRILLRYNFRRPPNPKQSKINLRLRSADWRLEAVAI